jgi:hypothetical protein
MKYSEVFAVIFLQGVLVALALPHGHYSTLPNLQSSNNGQPHNNNQGGQKFVQIPNIPQAAASQNNPYSVPPPGQVDYDYQVPSSTNLNTNYIQAPCTTTADSNGDLRVNCRVRNPQDLTFRTKHILWITPGAQGSQNYNIDIDNYRLEELIQAAFKPGQDTSSKFNILVKRPQHSYDAQIEKLTVPLNKPEINLQYEPVKDLQVHYPTDKQYSPLPPGTVIDRPYEGQGSISPRFSRNPSPQQHQQIPNSFQQPAQQFQRNQFRPSLQTPYPQIQKRSA